MSENPTQKSDQDEGSQADFIHPSSLHLTKKPPDKAKTITNPTSSPLPAAEKISLSRSQKKIAKRKARLQRLKQEKEMALQETERLIQEAINRNWLESASNQLRQDNEQDNEESNDEDKQDLGKQIVIMNDQVSAQNLAEISNQDSEELDHKSNYSSLEDNNPNLHYDLHSQQHPATGENNQGDGDGDGDDDGNDSGDEDTCDASSDDAQCSERRSSRRPTRISSRKVQMKVRLPKLLTSLRSRKIEQWYLDFTNLLQLTEPGEVNASMFIHPKLMRDLRFYGDYKDDRNLLNLFEEILNRRNLEKDEKFLDQLMNRKFTFGTGLK